MKKVIALFMAVLCIFSVFCISAFAETVTSRETDVKIISGIKGPSGGGSITPPSSEYSPGDDVVFHIRPNKGYKIKQVWVNGVAVGPVSEYLFKNIQEDSTIYVEFEKISDETTKSGNQNHGKTSPDTGAGFETVVWCAFGALFVGGIAAVSVAKKGRKEEY